MSGRPNRFRFRAVIFSHLIALGLLAVYPATAAEEPGAKFQGIPVLPGKTISAAVPLSPEEKTYAAIGGNRVPVNAVATLAVPPGFDLQKSWPVLIVSSASDFQRENRLLSQLRKGAWLQRSFTLSTARASAWIATAQTKRQDIPNARLKPALLDVAQGKSQDSLNAMIANYEKRTAGPDD
jgi:hypothetical protein